jgi:outer membrane biosynthesis protein TonB
LKIVIELNRDDLIAALAAGMPVKAEVSAPKLAKPAEKKPAKVTVVESEEFDESDEPAKPAKPAKAAKAKAKPAPVEEEAEEEETEEEAEEEETEEEAEEESEEEDEFITGDDLSKLKKALNAHKAAQGGKPKKTLEILRKFAPGGSEKVKPDVLPKLLKALKV